VRILFANTLYAPEERGGAEVVVRLLAEEAARRGHDVAVVCGTNGRVEPGETIGGVAVHRVRLSRLQWDYGAANRRSLYGIANQIAEIDDPLMDQAFDRVIEVFRPEVLHTHHLPGLTAAIWRAAQRHGLPTVHTHHAYYLVCANSSTYAGGKSCERPCLRCRLFTRRRKAVAMKAVAIHTVVSRRMEERLRAFGGLGSDADVRCVTGFNTDVPEMLSEGLQPRLTLGFIGRIDATKGLEVLLEAMGRAPGAMLRVAGPLDDSYASSLRDRYQSPRIAFLGRSDPRAFFGTIDLLVVPSVWEEPLGRVVHEAIGHGVPVIGSRIGGIAEMLEDSGAGRLFAPGSVDDLARTIAAIAEDPSAIVAMKAHCRVAAEAYTMDAVYGQYEAAWRDAASRRATFRSVSPQTG
jgi:glycosyltransferase involved in cell wall biosynthesis